MTESKQRKMGSEVCSIRILFPVQSDEQAIAYKKQIEEMLVEVPDAVIDFRLMTGKPPMPTG